MIRHTLTRLFRRPSARGNARRPGVEALEARTVLSATGQVGNLVAFGDSLSDAGNVSVLTRGALPGPAYANGRFSGGPIWVDTLAESLGEPAVRPSQAPSGGGRDYAFGGATLAYVNTAPPFAAVPRLGQQVGQYLAGTRPAANDLFTLWGGANDFFYSFEQTGTPINPAEPAAAMGQAIQTLINAGGRRFVVGNLPALGQTPYFQDLLEAGRISAQQVGQINQWSAGFNLFLGAQLSQLRQANPGATIVTVDVAGLFAQAARPNNPYGFTNWTDAAGTYDASGRLTKLTAGDPKKYLFFDGVHPGAAAHQLIGQQAAAAVRTALGAHTLTVTTTLDAVNPLDGRMSLREAMALANAMPGRQTIDFNLGAGAREIRLTGGQLEATDSLRILGPGADRLHLSGNSANRILAVTTNADVEVWHLTLRHGRADKGGAIRNAGRLTLWHTHLASNRADGGSTAGMGGAIYNTGTLTAHFSNFLGNTATGATAGLGGAIFSAAGRVELNNSLLVLNTAQGGSASGGAVFAGTGSTLEMTNGVITANRAVATRGGSGTGGGVYLAAGSTFRRRYGLIVGNIVSTAGWDVFQA